MKPKYLSWLLVATFLIWSIPWEAKKLYPDIFGSSCLQWGAAIISSLFLSLGMFLSIHSFFTYPEQRRNTGWTCIGFITLFSLILGFYGLAGPMLSRLNHSVDTLSMRDSVPRLMQRLQEAKTEEKRQIIAKAIYIFSGVSVPYQSEDSAYIIYQPTQKDKESWIQTQETEAKADETKEILNWQLKQLPWLISLYICSFFITFFIGILVIIYRKKKSEQGAAPNVHPRHASCWLALLAGRNRATGGRG